MARLFISGSSAGLGLMAADRLISQGHKVVLHARNVARAEDARRELPKIEAVVRPLRAQKILPPRSTRWVDLMR